jgi:hypothetical protein
VDRLSTHLSSYLRAIVTKEHAASARKRQSPHHRGIRRTLAADHTGRREPTEPTEMLARPVTTPTDVERRSPDAVMDFIVVPFW